MPGVASGTSPAIDAVLTICPPSACSTILGRNAWIPLITPYRLTPTTQSQSEGLISCALRIVTTPALLQITWAPPSSSTTLLANVCIDVRSVTSITEVEHRTPICSTSLATAAKGSSSTSARAMCIPSAANARASARPIPPPPPVITATLSFKSLILVSL